MKMEPTENSTRCISGNNILVFAPNWLGDSVMSLPFFFTLRKAVPQARITVICRRYVSEIFARLKVKDKLLVMEKTGLLETVSVIRKSSGGAGNYDICFILPPSFSSALAVLLAGIKRRVGYGTDFRSLLLTDSLKGSLYRRGHIIERYLQLIERSGLYARERISMPVLSPPPDWKVIIKKLKIPEGYAVLSPGASYGEAKRWPPEKYRKLAQKIYSENSSFLAVVGSDRERDYLDRICIDNSYMINLAGRIDIHELTAVLRGAEAVVGNDSGTVHLSAALGVPTVAIFGSTSPEWTAPRGSSVEIISTGIPCSPCFDRECGRHEYPKCYDDIMIEDVYDAYCQLRKRS